MKVCNLPVPCMQKKWLLSLGRGELRWYTLCVLVWWNRCCFGDPGCCRVALGFSKRLQVPSWICNLQDLLEQLMEEHTVIVSDLNEAPLRSLRISSFFFVLVNGIPSGIPSFPLFFMFFICFSSSFSSFKHWKGESTAPLRNFRASAWAPEFLVDASPMFAHVRHDVAMPKMSYSKCVTMLQFMFPALSAKMPMLCGNWGHTNKTRKGQKLWYPRTVVGRRARKSSLSKSKSIRHISYEYGLIMRTFVC